MKTPLLFNNTIEISSLDKKQSNCLIQEQESSQRNNSSNLFIILCNGLGWTY